MAELSTLARPYAEAVARLARDGNSWSEWSNMLGLLAGVAADPQLAAMAGNPAMPGETLLGIVLDVCADGLNAEGKNLAQLLVEGKRLAVLPQIVDQFEAMKAAQEGVLEARITTAYELTTEQLNALVVKLEAKFGRKINASQALRPELIGGVVIAVGDEVMDASVRGKLGELAATLKA